MPNALKVWMPTPIHMGVKQAIQHAAGREEGRQPGPDGAAAAVGGAKSPTGGRMTPPEFQRVRRPWLYWRRAIFVVLMLAMVAPFVAGMVAGLAEVL